MLLSKMKEHHKYRQTVFIKTQPSQSLSSTKEQFNSKEYNCLRTSKDTSDDTIHNPTTSITTFIPTMYSKASRRNTNEASNMNHVILPHETYKEKTLRTFIPRKLNPLFILGAFLRLFLLLACFYAKNGDSAPFSVEGRLALFAMKDI